MVKEERCYLHLYYDREKAADDQGRINRYLSALKSELEQKKEIPEHQKDYEKYFDVTDTPKRARKIVAKDTIIEQATKDYGYLSYIKKRMQAEDLFRKWTLKGLLDELDMVECFEAPGNGRMLGEMTIKQVDLYQKLGIDPPSLEVSGI